MASKCGAIRTRKSIKQQKPVKKYLKTKTLIIVLLDESTSMEDNVSDVLWGYNEFLEKQRDPNSTDKTRLTLIKFNTICTVIQQPASIHSVCNLTRDDYNPLGSTALFDAIAEGVRLGDKNKLNGERVLCVIITDGEENSSKKTTMHQVRDIISAREAKGDWTFTYMGEKPDKLAKVIGVRQTNMANFNHKNILENFNIFSYATYAFLQQSERQQLDNFFGRS